MSGDRGKLGPSCPFCRSNRNRVLDSRWHLPTMTKRRKRHCDACGEPFYTEETALSVRIEKQHTISSRPITPTS
jgi:transcriptional regulator NrdR family protein